MNSTCILCFCVCIVSFCQGADENILEYSKRLKATTEDLRTTSQAASDHLKQEVDKFYSALGRHEIVKRDIESSFDHLTNRVDDAPEHCKKNVETQLNGLKTQAVNEYIECTSKTIFKSVGDSVKIVTISFDLFDQIFKSLDDLLNGFTNCYSSGILHSIGCTVVSMSTLISDIKSTVDSALTYGDSITSLSAEITNIINVCQNKSHKSSYEAAMIISSC